MLDLSLKPLGSVGPRLSTGNDIKVNIKPTKTTLTLLCLAQAYPVPFFRFLRKTPSGNFVLKQSDPFLSTNCPQNRSKLFDLSQLCIILEPVGSVAPKLTSGDESRIVKIGQQSSATLLCPAQAYPVPFFRAPLNQATKLLCPAQAYPVPIFSVSPKITGGDDNIKTPKFMLTQKATLLCPAQAYPVPYFRFPYALYHPTSRQISFHGIVNLLNKFPYIRFRLEPMGTVSPKVTVGEDFKHIKTLMNKGLKPVSSVKPKINVQDKLQTREISALSDFALLCPSQSYPTPVYR
uniref:Uncharacterized protein n=1 Tax=Glossina pallidipes TaxID=7398 RepID=A0A1B0AGE7_GLOPL